MAITLDLKPEVEERLEARAKESGLSLKGYLEKRLEEMFSVPEPRPEKTLEERRDYGRNS
jgi:hypothetical protein